MSDKDEALRLCDDWTVNYGLDRDPHELHDYWANGAPPGCPLALKAAVEHIRSQHARITELEAVARVALGALVWECGSETSFYADKTRAAIESLRKTLGEA